MKQQIIDKILKHASKNEHITIRSTADALEISLKTARDYLVDMTLKKLLVMEELEAEESQKRTGYTYRFWRLKQ